MKMSELIKDYTNGKLDEILQFAWNHPKAESLQKCFTHLEKMCGNRSEDTVAELHYDFAPMSLGFTLVNTKTNNVSLSGGLIYHGPVKGQHSETLSVTIEPTDGWQLHT